MALMLKLPVLMHVSFLRRAIYAVQAVTNALLSWPGRPVSPSLLHAEKPFRWRTYVVVEPKGGLGRGRQLCSRASLSI